MSQESFQAYQQRCSEFIKSAGDRSDQEHAFQSLAHELFSLQYQHNPTYQSFCKNRGVTPEKIRHWQEIPALSTQAFKQGELTALPPGDRPTYFLSSGTTQSDRSRHYHNVDSLKLYEQSLSAWFSAHVLPEPREPKYSFISLTPSLEMVPTSSLVHMFDTVMGKLGGTDSFFGGKIDALGNWILCFETLSSRLYKMAREKSPVVLLGTAFSFVHLLELISQSGRSLQLPSQSRLLETGGYKGRSRELPKAQLHRELSLGLGIAPEFIVTEYGMSELSSQAYDRKAGHPQNAFQFPPWARAQVLSPETLREVPEGEIGLLKVVDLANAYSVMALQTEDLAIKRGKGFDLIGRQPSASPKGCSLLALPERKEG